jgi:uncharacterized OsmC-like protein
MGLTLDPFRLLLISLAGCSVVMSHAINDTKRPSRFIAHILLHADCREAIVTKSPARVMGIGKSVAPTIRP